MAKSPPNKVKILNVVILFNHFILKYKMINVVLGESRFKPNRMIDHMTPFIGYLHDNMIDHKIIEFADEVRSTDNNMHFGIFNHVLFSNLPKNYIVFNIEPYCNLNDVLKVVIAKARYLCYYIKDETLLLNKDNVYFPFPYHPRIENFYKVEPMDKSIDVLFYGSINNKRKMTLEYLRKKFQVVCPNMDNERAVFGKERDILIQKSRVVLSLKTFESDQDVPRIAYLAANRACVVAYSEPVIANAAIYCSSLDDVIAQISTLLLDDTLRKKVSSDAYNSICARHIENYLDMRILGEN